MKTRRAFTLIEMLVVIAIIGIVAALVVNMNGAAQAAKRNSQVNADKASLMLMIKDYKAKLNFYPPDNALMATNPVGPDYDLLSATNPLLYELTGATLLTTGTASGNYLLFDGTSNTPPSSFQTAFGRSTVANSNPDEPHDFFLSGPQLKEYTNYNFNSTLVTNIAGLVVPVPLYNYPSTNYWHYDASSTNRHNRQSFDLWAEYIIGNNGGNPVYATNGNW